MGALGGPVEGQQGKSQRTTEAHGTGTFFGTVMGSHGGRPRQRQTWPCASQGARLSLPSAPQIPGVRPSLPPIRAKVGGPVRSWRLTKTSPGAWIPPWWPIMGVSGGQGDLGRSRLLTARREDLRPSRPLQQHPSHLAALQMFVALSSHWRAHYKIIEHL